MNDTIVVIINGRSRCGKDTFTSLCMTNFNIGKMLIESISSVDKVREAAMLLGWDGKKTDDARSFLYKLKSLSDITYDASNKYILDRVRSTKAKILFVHIREPRCIRSLQNHLDKLNIVHYSLLIQSTRIEPLSNNISDSQVYNHDYDYTIFNNGSISDLESNAIEFIDNIISKTMPDNTTS